MYVKSTTQKQAIQLNFNHAGIEESRSFLQAFSSLPVVVPAEDSLDTDASVATDYTSSFGVASLLLWSSSHWA